MAEEIVMLHGMDTIKTQETRVVITLTEEERVALALAGYSSAASLLDADSMNLFVATLRSMDDGHAAQVRPQDVARAWNLSVGF